jgi:hypothetical protein
MNITKEIKSIEKEEARLADKKKELLLQKKKRRLKIKRWKRW